MIGAKLSSKEDFIALSSALEPGIQLDAPIKMLGIGRERTISL